MTTNTAATAATTPTEGTIRRYLSGRTVRGYPYLAECELEAYRCKDGRLVWRPLGPVARPNSSGVPSSWYRKGTPRAAEALQHFADAPRPWSPVQ